MTNLNKLVLEVRKLYNINLRDKETEEEFWQRVIEIVEGKIDGRVLANRRIVSETLWEQECSLQEEFSNDEEAAKYMAKIIKKLIKQPTATSLDLLKLELRIANLEGIITRLLLR